MREVTFMIRYDEWKTNPERIAKEIEKLTGIKEAEYRGFSEEPKSKR